MTAACSRRIEWFVPLPMADRTRTGHRSRSRDSVERLESPKQAQSFNPFPPLLLSGNNRISDRSRTPPWAATDRNCGTVGRVRIYTN